MSNAGVVEMGGAKGGWKAPVTFAAAMPLGLPNPPRWNEAAVDVTVITYVDGSIVSTIRPPTPPLGSPKPAYNLARASSKNTSPA